VKGCRSDDQCASGNVCRRGSCVPSCARDEQCGPGKICDDRACHSGCRSDDQCASGNICDDNGDCLSGCYENDQCGAGEVCVNNVCVVGQCAVSEDCNTDEMCVCRKCVVGCRDDQDCPSGSFCDQRVGFTCPTPQCHEVPSVPPLTCGAASCPGYSMVQSYALDGELGRRAIELAPCCLPDATCGIDFSGLVGGAPRCQAPVYDFTTPSACPEYGDLPRTFESCTRPDFTCGLEVSLPPDARAVCFAP
jgi:hypothetical protein